MVGQNDTESEFKTDVFAHYRWEPSLRLAMRSAAAATQRSAAGVMIRPNLLLHGKYRLVVLKSRHVSCLMH